MSMINNNQVRNRRMVRDLIEFLDVMRPSNIGINEWNDIIASNLKVLPKTCL